MSEDLGITTKKEEDINEWYREVIKKSELANYSAVSGCFVFRPLSYSIWEEIRKQVDRRFKDIGIENAYFPLFIPERFLAKEAEHFEGFTPEVAWVTETGSSELDEKLAVRPTSEAIMYDSYNDWIRSWRDLPLRLNQWNNVVRWEFKHATPFLRTREFLWNEGHNAYASEEEARKDGDKVLDAYQTVCEDYMAIPCVRGRKTEKEKFDGAIDTYSLEHVLPDGRAIQGPDYHYDGKNFAKAFDITYMDEDGEEKYVHQSTFAITTRQIGVMIMIHSDNRGLVIPPRLAPTKTVIVPIFNNEEDKEKVLSRAQEIKNELKDCKVDDREHRTPGWKFNEWEVRGIPLRIELGPREVENGEVTIVRRDNGEKTTVKTEKVREEVKKQIDEMHDSLFQKTKKFMEENTRETTSYDELKEIIEKKGGFVKAPWCGNQLCEDAIKDETAAKITNIPEKYEKPEGEKCIYCGEEAKHWVHFAKSY
ncbi:MAG: proline--tRNA ligase [Candidatus Aenigmatarchaeota archaeon]